MSNSTESPAAPQSVPRCKTGHEIIIWLANFIAGLNRFPEGVAYFLINSEFQDRAEKSFEQSPRAAEISDRMDEIKREHLLDVSNPNEGFGRGVSAIVPQEYRDLERAYEAAYDEHLIELFREHGLTDLADLYKNDRAEYGRLVDEGRAFFLA